MARGRINGTTSSEYVSAWISWESTVNVADNTSTVVAWFYIDKSDNSTSDTYGTLSRSLRVGGVGGGISSSSNFRIKPGQRVLVASQTATVQHNADGKKQIAISGSGGVAGTSLSSFSASGTITLDTIPRGATITSAPNFNDEENPTIKYSNPAGNAVESLKACISLDGSKDDIAYRDISKTGTSYTFNLTEAERNVLRNATTTANSRSVRFYVQTVINGETLRNNVSKTFSIINANPILLRPTANDVGSVSAGITMNREYVIKGYNTMSVAANASAQKGATIKTYKISCGGKSITTASGTLNNVESGTVIFTATDSRGNTTTATVEKTLIPYVKLTCNIAAKPPTTDGNLTFTIKGNHWNGSFGGPVSNYFGAAYRIKENDGDFSEWIYISAKDSGIEIIHKNNTYSADVSLTGLNYKSTYTLEAIAVDAIYNGNTEPYKTASVVLKTTPVFDWSADDFKFNVPVRMENGTPLQGKSTTGENVNLIYLSASDFLQVGGGAYPPKRVNINTQDNDGQVYINGREYAKNRVLWSGSYYMTEGQTATLDETISSQTSGIILVFSRYDIANSEPLNEHFSCHFVPKQMIELQEGKGYVFNMNTATYSYSGSKYVYIDDDKIRGNAANGNTGTGDNGISYNNNRFVLRYVIGV